MHMESHLGRCIPQVSACDKSKNKFQNVKNIKLVLGQMWHGHYIEF